MNRTWIAKMNVVGGCTVAQSVVAVIALAVVMSGQRAQAQPGTVLSHQKISDTEGGFTGTLANDDWFCATASLGDLDGDGVRDMAVGASGDDDGGLDRGAVRIPVHNTAGTVKSHQKISDTEGGFTGILDDGDNFGWHLASLGDLDGDGVVDLAVGAPFDDDGGPAHGAVWILFLNVDTTDPDNPIVTVDSHQKISDTEGGFEGILDDFGFFGFIEALLGDHDGDGVVDLAVAASHADDGGPNRGQVWILLLNPDGTVKCQQKISSTAGGFRGTLDDEDLFGQSLGSLGDLDGDDVGDLAVGAPGDNDGGTSRGAMWVLFLNTNGTVKSHRKISDTEGGFTGILDNFDFFGETGNSLGDLDGDGVADLAVGATRDDDGGLDRGAVWVLFLNTDGTVKTHQKISATEGGFTGILNNGDWFSWTPMFLGDLDGDGVGELAVGGLFDDDGGTDRGAVWILFLDGVATTPPIDFNAFRGFYESGDLNSLLASDGGKLCYNPGITIFPAEAPVTLDFFGILPNDSPATLDVTIESSANTVGLELTFSFWNYNSNSWDVVGVEGQSLNADTVRTFAGNPADHVEPGTGEVRTRYEVRQAGIIFVFPWLDCVDHVYWTTG